jgi:hypothetical protein
MLLIDVDIESSSLAKPAEKPGFNLSEILVLVYLSAQKRMGDYAAQP